MRAFLAVNIPENLRKDFSKLCRALRDSGDFSFVRPEKMHATIAFFDELPTNKVDEVKKIVEECAQKEFKIKCVRVGAFSRRGIPSVVFIETVSEELAKMAADIRARLKESSIKFDDKPFSQHVTLARAKSLNDEKMFHAKFENIKKAFQECEFAVDKITLLSSNMLSYKVVFDVALEKEEQPAESCIEEM